MVDGGEAMVDDGGPVIVTFRVQSCFVSREERTVGQRAGRERRTWTQGPGLPVGTPAGLISRPGGSDIQRNAAGRFVVLRRSLRGMQLHATGPFVLLAAAVGIGACASLPVIPASHMGCYAVSVMPLTAEHRREGVDAPPPVIQVDTAYGGLTFLPVSWLEAGGLGRREAFVSVERPQAFEIHDGRIVRLRAGPVTALPPDSLTFRYWQGISSLTGFLKADGTGSWSGLGSTGTGLSPIVDVRLTRRECPEILFGRPRG